MSDALADQSGPVTKKNRIQSIDTLRGVALFGILIMNIIAFGLPIQTYFNPNVWGDLQGLNLTAYFTMDVFFEGSMRAIFSMLFGAGVVLFTSKKDDAKVPLADLWFRRTTLLILFGVINAYVLLWIGDILYVYGVAGLFLFIFRNSSPTKLLVYAAVILSVLALVASDKHEYVKGLSGEVAMIKSVAEGDRTEDQKATLAEWNEYLGGSFALPEQAEADLELRKGGYLEVMTGLAPINQILQTVELYTHTLWDALAMMLIGMAFFKLGIFDAVRSLKFYAVMLLLGFGIAIPVNYYEVVTYINSDYNPAWAMSNIRPTYDVGRLGMAVGYIGLVMLICKLGIIAWLTRALAAVGQMALTNYLSHSVICAVLFMGFGFGLVGELERHELYYVVLAIWTFQLITSPIWLKFFRFGPVEWLWRTMTYMERQPFRAASQ